MENLKEEEKDEKTVRQSLIDIESELIIATESMNKVATSLVRRRKKMNKHSKKIIKESALLNLLMTTIKKKVDIETLGVKQCQSIQLAMSIVLEKRTDFSPEGLAFACAVADRVLEVRKTEKRVMAKKIENVEYAPSAKVDYDLILDVVSSMPDKETKNE